MSEYEKKNNRGAAFLNKAKEKPSQPDFIGTVMIDGKEKRVALWKNKATDGSEYFTFIFSEQFTEEEKSNYRNADTPAQAPIKKFEQKSAQPSPSSNLKNTQIKNENNEMNDLQEILNLDDDDTPF